MTNTNTNKQTQNVKVVVNNTCCPKPKPKRKPRKKPQPPPQPTIPPVPPQQTWQRGIQPTPPRPILYVPPTQQIMPEVTPMGIPLYFQTAYTNLQTTMNTMRENFNQKLEDLRHELTAQATKQAHIQHIQRITQSVQTEFEDQLRQFGQPSEVDTDELPPLEEAAEPRQEGVLPLDEEPTPVEPHRPLEGLWGDEELDKFMKPTPVKDLINKFEKMGAEDDSEDIGSDIFSPENYDKMLRIYGKYQAADTRTKKREVRKQLKRHLAGAGYEVEGKRMTTLMTNYDKRFKEMNAAKDAIDELEAIL